MDGEDFAVYLKNIEKLHLNGHNILFYYQPILGNLHIIL